MSIINITEHNPRNNEYYFLDCNVLMYNFYTNGEYASDLIYEYSLIVSKIISAGAKILITDVLLSEFINTYIQTEFHRLARLNGWPGNKRYFKYTFRNTPDYKDILIELKYIIIRQLLPITERINGDFANMSLEHIFNDFTTFDFNDRYYSMCMNRENAYIITNDSDFSDTENCSIITKNAALLSIAS